MCGLNYIHILSLFCDVSNVHTFLSIKAKYTVLKGANQGLRLSPKETPWTTEYHSVILVVFLVDGFIVSADTVIILSST